MPFGFGINDGGPRQIVVAEVSNQESQMNWKNDAEITTP